MPSSSIGNTNPFHQCLILVIDIYPKIIIPSNMRRINIVDKNRNEEDIVIPYSVRMSNHPGW